MSRICTVFSALLILFGLHGAAFAQTSDIQFDYAVPPPATGRDAVELYRLRIVNRRDGAIQISTDAGDNWRLLGRVLVPATTAAEGYTAAQYCAPGTVAAIAVHGIRIRVGADDPTVHDPLVVSIDPVEYAGIAAQDPDKGYGGLVTGSAGILTDIHAGTSIFRDVAPLVGNTVCLEKRDGSLISMGSTFRPTGKGEILVLLVTAPRVSLTVVTLENKLGGEVKATFADGTARTLSLVAKPVVGVGRFDGTAYTGVGRINTDHTGVITVSTAPIDTTHQEGTGAETRGGFQISPNWHNARLEEAGAATVITLGDPNQPRHRDLEATEPLFKSDVSLGSADDPNSAICDVSIDGGDWEPMPTIVGSVLDAFTPEGLTRIFKAQGSDRVSSQGVTAFRLRFAPLGVERARAAATAAVDACRLSRYMDANAGKLPIVHDLLTVNANPTDGASVAYVRLLIEDTPRGMTNIAPYSMNWNTRTVPDGEYMVEADALSSQGEVLAVTRKKVFVLNHAPPHAPSPTAARPVAPTTPLPLSTGHTTPSG